MKVAFASENGKHIDVPFGKCRSFSIFDWNEATFKWLETRTINDPPSENADDKKKERRVRTVQDCAMLFVSSIENHESNAVVKAGIMVLLVERNSEVIPQLEKMHQMLKERPPLWLIKAMRRS